jgi:Icc protein
LEVAEQPFHSIPGRIAQGNGHVVVEPVQFLRGRLDRLPSGWEALILCSDLQGRELSGGGESRLLGEAAAEELALLAELRDLPDASRTGVILAGDFYAAPELDRRGCGGDVRPVWTAFAERFHAVLGVAGNHDTFDDGSSSWHDLPTAAVLLDGDSIEKDGCRIVGLGGIIDRPGRPHRRDETAFRSELRRLTAARPEVLVLHQGPDVPERGLMGSAVVREELRQASPLLVVCGHCYWAAPVAELSSGVQVVNVDSRVVVLTAG